MKNSFPTREVYEAFEQYKKAVSQLKVDERTINLSKPDYKSFQHGAQWMFEIYETLYKTKSD